MGAEQSVAEQADGDTKEDGECDKKTQAIIPARNACVGVNQYKDRMKRGLACEDVGSGPRGIGKGRAVV